LGYDTKDRKITVNETEAERVRTIFRSYLKLGSLGLLMQDLRTKGIVTKICVLKTGETVGGIPFTRGPLAYLLRNSLSGNAILVGRAWVERLRPLDTYAFWYSRAVARRTANPTLRAIPMLLTAGVLFRLIGWSAYALRAPSGVEAALLFAASIALVIGLSAAVSALMDTLTVATLSERGVTLLIGPLIIVFSGSLVPLPLFPDWSQPILRNQPFAGLMDTPFRIYSGHLAGRNALLALARQVVWIVALVMIGRALMARVMTRLQTQGG